MNFSLIMFLLIHQGFAPLFTPSLLKIYQQYINFFFFFSAFLDGFQRVAFAYAKFSTPHRLMVEPV